MKKIILIFLAIMLITGFVGCKLEPINNADQNSESTSSDDTTSDDNEEESEIYVAYNVDNVWHEELLVDSFDEETVSYWNYICDDLRYWDKECTDTILNNDSNAVNSQTGRVYWNGTTFVPYIPPTT
jgi:hypothetical protein